MTSHLGMGHKGQWDFTTIDGKRFYLRNRSRKKKYADDAAKRLRSEGYLARVVPILIKGKQHYEVYARWPGER